MTRQRLIFRHSFNWLLFIIYETIFLRFTAGHYAPLLQSVIFYALNIALFYFNAHVVLEFSFSRSWNGYLLAGCLILPEILVYLMFKYLLDIALSPNTYAHSSYYHVTLMYLFTNFWRGLYFIGLSIGYWSMGSMLRFREKNYLMETEQLKSVTKNLELENKVISIENAYLQSQISPHLVYNSLNFIYSSIYRMSESAGRGVMLLADLMRYSLVGADDTRTVLLADEWREMENLVELCRLRFGDDFFVRCRKSGKISGIRIIPLVLITLVENMMKHGDLGEKKFPALINLEIADQRVVLRTRNKKRNHSLHPKGGVGLKNIEKRLKNFYQEKYMLVIADERDAFLVTLILQL